jgi:hypothetical protein
MDHQQYEEQQRRPLVHIIIFRKKRKRNVRTEDIVGRVILYTSFLLYFQRIWLMWQYLLVFNFF